MSHSLRCRCGVLHGVVAHPAKANRGVCYCRDCQAYAHFLGRAADILDDMGGTDVVATVQQDVTFTQGLERLACVSLTPRGLLRWYATCCNTPIGNTPRDFKVTYVGLIHSCLENGSTTLDDSFGPVRMRVNRKSARRKPAATPIGTTMAILRLMTSLVSRRIAGSYRQTPFFEPDRGAPVVSPKVLTRDERDRAMQHANPPSPHA